MSKTVVLKLDENENIPFEGEYVFARYSVSGFKIPLDKLQTATLIYGMDLKSREHVLFRAQDLLNDPTMKLCYDRGNPYKSASIACGRRYGDPKDQDPVFLPFRAKLAEYPELAKKAGEKNPKDLLKKDLQKPQGIPIEIPDAPAPQPADESSHEGSGGGGAAADGGGGGRSGASALDLSNPVDSVYFEGNRRVALHYRRERSGKLRQAKIDAVKKRHGKLACELCGDEGAGYPADCRGRLFEVHHKLPLAVAGSGVNTLLKDLAVLCANCHRAVHVDAEVEENFHELKAHFESQK